MTAKSLDANPTIQAMANTTNTMSDLEPAGLRMAFDPAPDAAFDAVLVPMVALIPAFSCRRGCPDCLAPDFVVAKSEKIGRFVGNFADDHLLGPMSKIIDW